MPIHDQAETGDLLARSIQDVDRVRFLTGRAFLRLVEGLFLLTGTAVFLVAMNPLLAALALVPTPLCLSGGRVRFGARYRPLSLEIQRSLGRLTNRVEQNLRGARVVKAFAQEERRNPTLRTRERRLARAVGAGGARCRRGTRRCSTSWPT